MNLECLSNKGPSINYVCVWGGGGGVASSLLYILIVYTITCKKVGRGSRYAHTKKIKANTVPIPESGQCQKINLAVSTQN